MHTPQLTSDVLFYFWEKFSSVSSNSYLNRKDIAFWKEDYNTWRYLLHQNIVVPLKSGLHIIFTFERTDTVFSLQTLPSAGFAAFLIFMSTTFSKAKYNNNFNLHFRFQFLTWRVRMLCQVSVALNALETTWMVLLNSGVRLT